MGQAVETHAALESVEPRGPRAFRRGACACPFTRRVSYLFGSSLAKLGSEFVQVLLRFLLTVEKCFAENLPPWSPRIPPAWSRS